MMMNTMMNMNIKYEDKNDDEYEVGTNITAAAALPPAASPNGLLP